MPLYTLQCQNPECRYTHIDVLEPMVVSQLSRRCAVCGGRVERVPTVSSFVVKGYSAKNGYSSK